ncbi:MAG: hypothetical protein WAW37_15605 [Syntrophobacteraceae bacterium]
MTTITQENYKTIFGEKAIICPNCMWPIELCACKGTFRGLWEHLKAAVLRLGGLIRSKDKQN